MPIVACQSSGPGETQPGTGGAVDASSTTGGGGSRGTGGQTSGTGGAAPGGTSGGIGGNVATGGSTGTGTGGGGGSAGMASGGETGSGGSPAGNPWITFDPGAVISRSNIVLGSANATATQFMPVGNGTLGAAVWAAGGFTAQLNRFDTFPDRKSPG